MESGFIKNIMISLAIAVVLVVVVNVIGELSVRPRPELPMPAKEAAEEAKQPEAESKAPEPAQAAPKAASAGVAGLLAAYDPAMGTKAFRKCKSCHTADKGGKNRVGPNLWDVVGREKGGLEGFRYSDAMKLKGGVWTYQDLDRYLANPRTFIMGTKMSIKGYSDANVRAALIGFLRSLSDNPKPLGE